MDMNDATIADTPVFPIANETPASAHPVKAPCRQYTQNVIPKHSGSLPPRRILCDRLHAKTMPGTGAAASAN